MLKNSRCTYIIKASILLVLTISFIIAALNWRSSRDKNEDDVKYLVGMSQANLAEPWRVVMDEEIRSEAAKYPDLRVIYTDAAQSSEKQIKDVEQLLGQGIDLLVISPNDVELLTPIIKEAHKSIPVIVLDREVEGSNYTLFIGADNRMIGQKAGEFVENLLGNEGGNVFEIQGLSGSPPVRDRSEGFREVIAKHNNIKIVETIVTDWLRDKTEDVLKEIITRYQKLDVVYAHNDAMAQGAYIAATKLRQKNIKFVGIDGLLGPQGGVELVRQGVLTGTFTCPTGGKEAIQYAIKILNNEKGLPKRLTLESKIITKEKMYIDN